MDATALRAFPPVHRLTTRGQWLVFAAVLMAIMGSGVPSVTGDLHGRGYDVGLWYGATTSVFRIAFMLAMARLVWRLLDGIPFAPGQRWRRGAARLSLGAAYAVVEATVVHAAMIVAVRAGGVHPRILAERDSQWTHHVVEGAAGFVILLVAHAVLQRSHEARQREALERSLVMARLEALSLELRPHFLFNTLNGIAALMRDDPRNAERMLVRLSDLLRITLQGGSGGEIALKRELEHLDLYLDLQAMRFGNRLTVVRDVDTATLAARVPCMLLQPLVENALTHGIGPRAGPGRLELAARRDGSMLVLRVRDNGVGLPSSYECRTGIGTTRARLVAMFDGAQSFTLSSAEGGGTVAEVRIPFMASART